ncbi:hypothetical protein BCR37DRAFT_406103 [Protomyces lactucae-debilis]|uniref:Uncharacterized protein n=1 Tax=Protomyces lactucae-debilis TaxID=2754530 RepID=A0A1Y2EYG1_PROLT|nr:uncharacterized protein BCR37DRAFT_406103 [Protomyces lactucae-debilis]ORY76633.1 hypothetical protein BCR37DRAFT_406103 [Protomyces lactucae-debilis]
MPMKLSLPLHLPALSRVLFLPALPFQDSVIRRSLKYSVFKHSQRTLPSFSISTFQASIMAQSALISGYSGTVPTLSRRRQALAASDRFTTATNKSSAPTLFKDLCLRWKLPGSNKRLLCEDPENLPVKRRKMALTSASAVDTEHVSADEAPVRGLFIVFNSYETMQTTMARSFSAAEKAHKRLFPNAEAENAHRKRATKPVNSASTSPSIPSLGWSSDANTTGPLPLNSAQPQLVASISPVSQDLSICPVTSSLDQMEYDIAYPATMPTPLEQLATGRQETVAQQAFGSVGFEAVFPASFEITSGNDVGIFPLECNPSDFPSDSSVPANLDDIEWFYSPQPTYDAAALSFAFADFDAMASAAMYPTLFKWVPDSSLLLSIDGLAAFCLKIGYPRNSNEQYMTRPSQKRDQDPALMTNDVTHSGIRERPGMEAQLTQPTQNFQVQRVPEHNLRRSLQPEYLAKVLSEVVLHIMSIQCSDTLYSPSFSISLSQSSIMFPSAPKSLIAGTTSTLSRRRQALAASDRFTSANNKPVAPILFEDLCSRWKLPGSNKHLLCEDPENSPAKRRKTAPTTASTVGEEDFSLFADEAPSETTKARSFCAAEKAHKRLFPNAEAENAHRKRALKPVVSALPSSLNNSASTSPSLPSLDWSSDAIMTSPMPINSAQSQHVTSISPLSHGSTISPVTSSLDQVEFDFAYPTTLLTPFEQIAPSRQETAAQQAFGIVGYEAGFNASFEITTGNDVGNFPLECNPSGLPSDSALPANMDDIELFFSSRPTYDSAAMANLSLAELDAMASLRCTRSVRSKPALPVAAQRTPYRQIQRAQDSP